MQIQLNGKPHTIADGTTVAGLVEELNLQGRRIAMEINGEIQPRSGYQERHLEDGDRVEIVHAIGGG